MPTESATRLKARVSYFRNAFALVPTGETTPQDLIAGIRKGKWADEVAEKRRYLERGDENGYKEAKKKLPAVSLSALLKTRAEAVPLPEKLIAHSGLLQIDIDEQDNPHLPTKEIVALLKADRFVALGFTSPSGKGVKAAVVIDGSRHLDSFLAAEDYFARKHSLKIDDGTKDTVRLCFISHDPDAWTRDDCEPLPVPEPAPEPARPTAGGNVAPGGEATTADDIREMLRFIPSKPDYGTWLRIASAVWSVLSFVEGTQLLMEWSPELKPGEYAKKFKKRLTKVRIGTLVMLAKAGGFDAREAARRRRWCGRIKFGKSQQPDRDDEPGSDPVDDADTPTEEDAGAWKLNVWHAIEAQQQGDARLWAQMTAGLIKYDSFRRGWYRYSSGVWQRDDLNTMRNEMADTLNGAYIELAETIEAELAANPPKPKKKGEPDDPRVVELKAVLGRIRGLRRLAWNNGAMEFAQQLQEFVCQPSDFDCYPHLLACENGTLDFRKKCLVPHDPGHMQQNRAPVTYDPSATCPRFDEFLALVMDGDNDLIDYLWRAIGYSLTGFVDADVTFILYGAGANGKSTLNSTIAMLMGGGLHSVVDIETFLSRGKCIASDVDYKKSMLEGKRRVVTDEVPDGRRLNESTLKALTGGDDIIARRPYQLPYTFSPTHKLWIAGNHKPDIRGDDEGIWRRIHLVPWLVTIPVEKRRPRSTVLAEFRQELPGILNRAIRGFLEYDEGGLQPPAKVLAATSEYRESSDQLGQFLAERTVKRAAETVRVTDLLKAFLAWCADNSEMPLLRSGRKLTSKMRERGYRTERGHSNYIFICDIALTDTNE